MKTQEIITKFRIKTDSVFWVYYLLIFLISVLLQLLLIGKFLDNQIITKYSPTAIDAEGYSFRALEWRKQGFESAFADLSRMPGYPFILLVMNIIFPGYQYLATRLLQLLLLAVSSVILLRILTSFMSKNIAFLFSVLFNLLPIWHFVPVLIAESLTAVTVVILAFLLNQYDKKIEFKNHLLIGMTISISTYLKPNNLILIFVAIVFVLFTRDIKKVFTISTIIITVLILLLPWVAFTNKGEREFLGLTTTLGGNLYAGTGMHLSYDNSVLSNSAIKWKVDPKNNTSDILDTRFIESSIEKNKALVNRSLEIWTSRPYEQARYSIDKILIAFGLKANNALGYVFGIFNTIAILSSIVVAKQRKYRNWGYAVFTSSILLAFQAAIFQADRRFIVSIFIPLGVIAFAIAFAYISKLFRLENFRLFKGLQ